MVPTLLPCHPTLTSPLKSKNQTESYNNSCHEPFVQNHYKTTKPFLASSSSWSQSLPDSSLELSSSSDPANTCRSCRQTWQQLHSWVSTHVECPHIHTCGVSTHPQMSSVHTCRVSIQFIVSQCYTTPTWRTSLCVCHSVVTATKRHELNEFTEFVIKLTSFDSLAAAVSRSRIFHTMTCINNTHLHQIQTWL